MKHILSPQDAEAARDILVEQLHVQRSQLTPEARFKTDLGADSLAEMEIAMAMEDRFNVTIPDEQWPSDATVGHLFEILAELLATQQTMPPA